MPTEISIIGAGGHSKVVIEAILEINPSSKINLFDTDKAKQGAVILGQYTVQVFDDVSALPGPIHVAIGDNQARNKYLKMAADQNKEVYTVVHPDACVSPSARLGAGCFLAAKSVVGPESMLGDGVIVNHGAVVDHDCNISDCCHIAPNSTLGGAVTLGEGVLVGSGAVILPGVSAGENSTVGAGSVVTSNVSSNMIVTGIPARGNA
jgi:sugar O-acyltransferase (sialic acid O-acetyltransferase NeuD family)